MRTRQGRRPARLQAPPLGYGQAPRRTPAAERQRRGRARRPPNPRRRACDPRCATPSAPDRSCRAPTAARDRRQPRTTRRRAARQRRVAHGRRPRSPARRGRTRWQTGVRAGARLARKSSARADATTAAVGRLRGASNGRRRRPPARGCLAATRPSHEEVQPTVATTTATPSGTAAASAVRRTRTRLDGKCPRYDRRRDRHECGRGEPSGAEPGHRFREQRAHRGRRREGGEQERGRRTTVRSGSGERRAERDERRADQREHGTGDGKRDGDDERPPRHGRRDDLGTERARRGQGDPHRRRPAPHR